MTARVPDPRRGVDRSCEFFVNNEKETAERIRDEADAGVDEIQQINSVNIASKKVKVPAEIHNTMIEAGGKLIQPNMSDGRPQIKFSESVSGSDMVTVRGPTDDVEKAVKLLKEMSEKRQVSRVAVEIKAKPQYHKFLIGKAGIHIQKIRDDTGARIIFPGSDDTDKETIMIIGTQDACDKAKKIMEAKIVELDNIGEDSMTVASKYHKHFVARSGEDLCGTGVREMMNKYYVNFRSLDKVDEAQKSFEVSRGPAIKPVVGLLPIGQYS